MENMSKAEEYADRLIRENYGYDEHDVDYDSGELPFDLDDRMDPPVRYRDMRAWLVHGFEAGQRVGPTERQVQDAHRAVGQALLHLEHDDRIAVKVLLEEARSYLSTMLADLDPRD